MSADDSHNPFADFGLSEDEVDPAIWEPIQNLYRIVLDEFPALPCLKADALDNDELETVAAYLASAEFRLYAQRRIKGSSDSYHPDRVLPDLREAAAEFERALAESALVLQAPSYGMIFWEVADEKGEDPLELDVTVKLEEFQKKITLIKEAAERMEREYGPDGDRGESTKHWTQIRKASKGYERQMLNGLLEGLSHVQIKRGADLQALGSKTRDYSIVEMMEALGVDISGMDTEALRARFQEAKKRERERQQSSR